MTAIARAHGPGAAAGVSQGAEIHLPAGHEPNPFRGSVVERYENTPRHAVVAAIRALADDIEAGERLVHAIDLGSTVKQNGSADHTLRISFSTPPGYELSFGRRRTNGSSGR